MLPQIFDILAFVVDRFVSFGGRCPLLEALQLLDVLSHIRYSTRRHQLAIFKFCKSANFLRDKCANGPRTNFRLTTLSILQNINFSERVSRKLFNELFNFLSELLIHASPLKVGDTIYDRKYLQQYTKLSWAAPWAEYGLHTILYRKVIFSFFLLR